eukprot:TRINITY_DN16860_c0_g1_i1.p1 TRINITY_DN16860_c0_g1~~TRINITY_DN16860_c0_g1_i1.p1  ORF type:complete len:595 (+),score=104.89 TRINITY_DN16860_c0_g1_i1:52-1836(+)
MSLASMINEEVGRSWTDFGIDRKLLQGIKRMKFTEPTLIQSSVIPLALNGKDILARASTGSGKTAAYSIPTCHKLLTTLTGKMGKGGVVSALIMVPSRELCHQVTEHFVNLLRNCEGKLQVMNLASIEPNEWAGGRCEIAVGTPTVALSHVKAENISLSELQVSVIDEADCLLSHPTVRRLRSLYPTSTQSFLMSATLSPGVLELKRLLFNKPVVVKLEEEDENESTDGEQAPQMSTEMKGKYNPKITQYYLPCYNESEKFCFLYSLVRLQQIKGKILIFVDHIDKAYRVKLFLDKFGLHGAVLNKDVPVNSRNHIVAQYNSGEYNILIATEESVKHTSSEYSVSRGVDFREVSAVLNFDLPMDLTEESAKAYIHRIGRTGRAGKEGTAITFIPRKSLKSEGGRPTWLSYMNSYLESSSQQIVPHNFTESPDEALRLQYRTDDALQSIKKKMIKEEKVRELVSEAMASEVLKEHFAENPRDLAALKHVAPQKPSEQAAAACRSFVPDYMGSSVSGHLVVESCKQQVDSDDSDEVTAATKKNKGRAIKRKRRDPLRTLKVTKEAEPTPAGGEKVREKRRVVKRIIRKKKPAAAAS